MINPVWIPSSANTAGNPTDTIERSVMPSLPENIVITIQITMKSQDRVRLRKYNLSVNPLFLIISSPFPKF